MAGKQEEDLLRSGLDRLDAHLDRLEASISRTRSASVGGPPEEAPRKIIPKSEEKGTTMTEEQAREIKIPGGVARLTEQAWKEQAPTPEQQERARSTAAQARREGEEAERRKISVEDAGRARAEREIGELRRQQLLLWKNRGGTQEEFERSWPQIKADHIRQENQRALDRAAASSPY